jgi:hypothetical protein
LKFWLMAKESKEIFLPCKTFPTLETYKLQMISLTVGRSIVFQLSQQNSLTFASTI